MHCERNDSFFVFSFTLFLCEFEIGMLIWFLLVFDVLMYCFDCGKDNKRIVVVVVVFVGEGGEGGTNNGCTLLVPYVLSNGKSHHGS